MITPSNIMLWICVPEKQNDKYAVLSEMVYDAIIL